MNSSTETLVYSSQYANASQATLVDLSAYATPQNVVSFLRDDMRNTKIYSSDNRLLYTVESERNTNASTAIYRRDTRELVAEVKRKDLRADRIKFGKNSSIKLNSWLSGSSGKWTDLCVS